MALIYQSSQTYRDAFTYQGAGGASVVPTTASVAAAAYDATISTPAAPSTPVVTGRKPRGGMTTVVSRKIETPEPKPAYVPKTAPLSLHSQYDALLESGEISEEEWAALLMFHGVNPAQMVSA